MSTAKVCVCEHERDEHRTYNYFRDEPDTSCVWTALDLGGYHEVGCGCKAFTAAVPAETGDDQ